jgi:outer membrane murein-binding lipoprotein Lpp
MTNLMTGLRTLAASVLGLWLLVGCMLPEVEATPTQASVTPVQTVNAEASSMRNAAEAPRSGVGESAQQNAGTGGNSGEWSNSTGGSGFQTDAAGGSANAAGACQCWDVDTCCDGCQPMNEGNACEDDRLECTKDVCRVGRCMHDTAVGSTCVIEDACYEHMQIHPNNPCRYCDAQRTPNEWTGREGLSCDDGIFCNGADSCAAGGCVHQGDPCGGSKDPCTKCDEQQDSCPVDDEWTWYDSTNNLLWESGSALGRFPWQAAQEVCDALTLCSHDDWRLPSIDELRSLIDGCPPTEPGGSCGVTDGCAASDCRSDYCVPLGSNCEPDQGPNGGYYQVTGVMRADSQWSSTTLTGNSEKAWGVIFATGAVTQAGKTSISAARCVRTGRLE